jgi:hypothetical protein
MVVASLSSSCLTDSNNGCLSVCTGCDSTGSGSGAVSRSVSKNCNAYGSEGHSGWWRKVPGVKMGMHCGAVWFICMHVSRHDGTSRGWTYDSVDAEVDAFSTDLIDVGEHVVWVRVGILHCGRGQCGIHGGTRRRCCPE